MVSHGEDHIQVVQEKRKKERIMKNSGMEILGAKLNAEHSTCSASKGGPTLGCPVTFLAMDSKGHNCIHEVCYWRLEREKLPLKLLFCIEVSIHVDRM